MDESKKTESQNKPEEDSSQPRGKMPPSKGKGDPKAKPPLKEPGSEAAKPKAEKPVKKVPAAKGPVKRPVAKKVPPKPRQPKGPQYEDLEDDPLLEALKGSLGADNVGGQSFIGQKIYTVELSALFDAMLFLRDQPDWDFDYLVDLTALDYLEDEKRFCVVYQLYSYRHMSLIRVKSRLEQDETAPSVSAIWKTADWMEREVYDMFGIEFSGHPDLKRILLPDDWQGFPLRKDYDIKLQDQAWIRKHLRIRKVPN